MGIQNVENSTLMPFREAGLLDLSVAVQPLYDVPKYEWIHLSRHLVKRHFNTIYNV